MIKVKSCDECKFTEQCKNTSSIDNAYGGLECSKIWQNDNGQIERVVSLIFTEDRIKELQLLEQVIEEAKSLNSGNNFLGNVQKVIDGAKKLGHLDFVTPRDSFVEFLRNGVIASKNSN